MPSEILSGLFDFNIDDYLDPFIPPSHLNRLPKPIAHFLGYRSRPHHPAPTPLQWLTQIVATIAGLCMVSATYIYGPGLRQYNPPVIIASLGAAAVLDFNAIRSPLGQPRNAVVGHTFCAIIGVAISKLFQLSPHFHKINWVSGAVGCALASWIMSVTNSVHPPGGATALLASTDATILAMGWMFVPFVLIGTLLLLATALLMNNIFRDYPLYWWTASEEVGHKLTWLHRTKSKLESTTDDLEAHKSDQLSDTSSTNANTIRHERLHEIEYLDSGLEHIRITPYKVELPGVIGLEDDDVLMLEKLQEKLRKRNEHGT